MNIQSNGVHGAMDAFPDVFRRNEATRPKQLPRFFRGFLNAPTTVASLYPSTPAVSRAVCDAARARSATTVVELGAGTGPITQALLNHLPSTGRVCAFEVSSDFCQALGAIDDHRLSIKERSAENLLDVLERSSFNQPDVIVSGIPFSTLDVSVAESITAQIAAGLKPGGRFVTYQLRDSVRKYADKHFGPPISSRLVLASIPPLVVRTWTKAAA